MDGRTLGRYRLTGPAGQGAGAVLAAEDTLLERRVDLLLVPAAAAADAARMDRIRHEVMRAAAFVHPNVATVYGIEAGDGEVFVTREPATGRTLTSLLAAGAVPSERAFEVALALCDVMAGAKEAGVVHGDLHPDDVLVGEAGAVRVVGFGLHELRRAVEEEAGEPSPAAPYRPPEATAGLLPDHRADLFALGRILRDLVAAAGPVAEEGAPAGPAVAAVREILDRCLSDDPAQRPRSAAELRAPLEDLQREALREPEPESVEPPHRPSWRWRWGLPVGGLLLAAIAGWAIWRSAGPAGRPEETETVEPVAAASDLVDIAVLPFAGPEEAAEARLAVGFSREVTRLLATGRRFSVVSAGSAAAAARTADGAPIADRLGVAHLLEADFRWQRDEEISRAEVTVRLTRASDGELLWNETLEAFFGEIVGLQDRVAVGVARRLGTAAGPAGRPLTASLGAYEAYLEALGRAAEDASPDELRAALAALEQAVILDPGLLLAHARLADLRVRLDAAAPSTGALAAARRALAAARQIDPEHPEVRQAAGALALASGDAGAARGELDAALTDLPGDPGLLRAVALIDRRQGRWQEAIEGLRAARRRDPLALGLVTDLVETLARARRFEEALEEVDRLARNLPGALEPGLLRADLLLRRRGETERARAVLDEMPETARADARWQRAMLRLDLCGGRYESALARLPALRLDEAEELIERAWILRHMGRDRPAAATFERARDLLDDRLESEPGDPVLSALLGQAYAGTGGPNLGIRLGQRAVGQLPVTVDAAAGAELVERLARIYVLAGDREHALDELAFLLEIPSPVTVAVLRLDPAWAPLREEARFQALLERFGAMRE